MTEVQQTVVSEVNEPENLDADFNAVESENVEKQEGEEHSKFLMHSPGSQQVNDTNIFIQLQNI